MSAKFIPPIPITFATVHELYLLGKGWSHTALTGLKGHGLNLHSVRLWIFKRQHPVIIVSGQFPYQHVPAEVHM